jgi:hypothetical protein
MLEENEGEAMGRKLDVICHCGLRVRDDEEEGNLVGVVVVVVVRGVKWQLKKA